MKYAFIRAQRGNHSLHLLCSALGVSPSGYYDWYDRPPSKTARENQRLVTKIRCYHQASRRIYGSPRIQQDLLKDQLKGSTIKGVKALFPALFP